MYHPDTTLSALEREAARRVPGAIRSLVAAVNAPARSGAAELARLRLRPPRTGPHARPLSCQASTAGHLLGGSVTMPAYIPPAPLSGLLRAGGEILAARAATSFGVPYALSMFSVCAIEDLRAGLGTEPFWFEISLLRDRQLVAGLIERARLARCPALLVSLSPPRLTPRSTAVARPHEGFAPRRGIGLVGDLLRHPSWTWSMLQARSPAFGNVTGWTQGAETLEEAARWLARQADATASWRDLAQVRRLWPGKLVARGVLTVAEAREAADAGADAVIVCRSPGDTAESTPSHRLSPVLALPAIVGAVGARVEVHLEDGGDSGADLAKALALGAQGVGLGASHLAALASRGEEGVVSVLTRIAGELRESLRTLGHASVETLGPSVFGTGTGPARPVAQQPGQRWLPNPA